MYRIGFGFDTHRLKEGRPLVLGGVKVASLKGAVGHSDADVLIHAICDALLGAVNLRDIGAHFPDTDGTWLDVDSRRLLATTYEKVKGKGYSIVNIDSTICLEAPKLASHIPDMQEALARVLSIETANVSIKATTGEKMGFIGRNEGIAAYATVLLTSALHP